MQKEIHAHYVRNSVQIEAGELDPLCEAAKNNRVAAYVGIIERALNRGGHSLYASLVYLDQMGEIKSVHRKLMPTYEERLTWSPGDGHGLRVHSLKEFTVGDLNCWENWLPLARASLYGQGEDLHIAVWPGSIRNTEDITCFIAKEARFTATIDFNRVLEERQNLDVAGHYSRPDVTQLTVNRERQSTLRTED